MLTRNLILVSYYSHSCMRNQLAIVRNLLQSFILYTLLYEKCIGTAWKLPEFFLALRESQVNKLDLCATTAIVITRLLFPRVKRMYGMQVPIIGESNYVAQLQTVLTSGPRFVMLLRYWGLFCYAFRGVIFVYSYTRCNCFVILLYPWKKLQEKLLVTYWYCIAFYILLVPRCLYGWFHERISK